MMRDSRLSGVLHVLLHMAEFNEPITSEVLAEMMGTNPVVVRRILSGLRERGYVHSEKGHGGGWSLQCDFATTTLRDIYEALGSPPLLAIGHRSETSACLVEQAVNAALSPTFAEAELFLLTRLGAVTLSVLSADFHQRLSLRIKTPRKAHKHAP